MKASESTKREILGSLKDPFHSLMFWTLTSGAIIGACDRVIFTALLVEDPSRFNTLAPGLLAAVFVALLSELFAIALLREVYRRGRWEALYSVAMIGSMLAGWRVFT